jgi:translation initiation factor IF-3
MAREQGVDLILVSPDAQPPVCRLVELSKFKYEQEKAAKDARKKQRDARCATTTLHSVMVSFAATKLVYALVLQV